MASMTMTSLSAVQLLQLKSRVRTDHRLNVDHPVLFCSLFLFYLWDSAIGLVENRNFLVGFGGMRISLEPAWL